MTGMQGQDQPPCTCTCHAGMLVEAGDGYYRLPAWRELSADCRRHFRFGPERRAADRQRAAEEHRWAERTYRRPLGRVR